MNHKRAGRREHFTVQEANAMLPLVRAIVADLVELSREVLDRRHRLSFLLAGRNPDNRDLYQQELVQIQAEMEKDKQRLREYAEELRTLGVEVVDGPEGVVSFPSVLEGRRVCLSWKLGEPEVLHWYEVNAGFRRRKPLTAGSVTSS